MSEKNGAKSGKIEANGGRYWTRTSDLLCVKQEVFVAKLRFWRFEAKHPIFDLLSRFKGDLLSRPDFYPEMPTPKA